MAKQTINIGASPNDGTGTPLRTAFDYCNLNFTELYTATGPSGNNIVVPGSATITGDLTVDTNVLKVDSTNNRVGIGTASPTQVLDVAGNISANAWLGRSNIAVPTGDCSIFRSADNTLAFGIASTTAMTLNATGLGVGVTPSAWNTYKAVQVGYASLGGYAGQDTVVGSNVYYESGSFKYISTAAACSYRQNSGGHNWNVAASGTAGNAITFTQAMTLDASGNLLVGTTSGTLFRIISSFLSSSGNGGIKLIDSQSNNTAAFANFSNGTGTLGSITNNNNAGVLYNVTSDKRLKENISDSESASSLIDSLQVRQFDWKANNSHQRYGFIAQELVTVVPEAVYQPTNSDEMMAVDYSKLVPMLIKEIQSLRARVQTLEAR
jgi:hypothetical protein